VKIGLSYSRCVRDIVDGVVDINDVLILITRTDFDPNVDEEWTSIWRGYGGGQTEGSPWSMPEWGKYGPEMEQKFRDVSIQLWQEGKFHQPRKFGAHPRRRSEIWLEAVLPDSELQKNPAVKKAWDKFQTLASLSSVELNDKYQ